MNNVERKQLGLIYYDPAMTYNGYTLFSTKGMKDIWLIDMYGNFVHRWQLDHRAVFGVLLPNGTLLYAGKIEPSPFYEFGADAAILQEINWEGKARKASMLKFPHFTALSRKKKKQ